MKKFEFFQDHESLENFPSNKSHMQLFTIENISKTR